MNRRSFIGSILAACAAPAIVRAESVMRVAPLVWVPDVVPLRIQLGVDGASEFERFSMGVLRQIAEGLQIPYEELTREVNAGAHTLYRHVRVDAPLLHGYVWPTRE